MGDDRVLIPVRREKAEGRQRWEHHSAGQGGGLHENSRADTGEQ